MIELKDIKKRYKQLEILHGVSLSIAQGDVHVIIGESGSGKTTFLRCINYLEKPDSGQIILGDLAEDYSHLSKKNVLEIRRKIGFVFQNYGLFRNKTALGNVMTALTVVHKLPKKEAEERARQAIAEVGLSDRLDHYPAQLSGGQQQRIGIARAIVTNPDIILMDEPTSSLDPGLVQEVLSTIIKLAEHGKTMLIVTHELSFARKVATTVSYMHRGQIVESAPTEAFFTQPGQEETLAFLRKSSLDYSFMI